MNKKSSLIDLSTASLSRPNSSINIFKNRPYSSKPIYKLTKKKNLRPYSNKPSIKNIPRPLSSINNQNNNISNTNSNYHNKSLSISNNLTNIFSNINNNNNNIYKNYKTKNKFLKSNNNINNSNISSNLFSVIETNTLNFRNILPKSNYNDKVFNKYWESNYKDKKVIPNLKRNSSAIYQNKNPVDRILNGERKLYKFPMIDWSNKTPNSFLTHIGGCEFNLNNNNNNETSNSKNPTRPQSSILMNSQSTTNMNFNKSKMNLKMKK